MYSYSHGGPCHEALSLHTNLQGVRAGAVAPNIPSTSGLCPLQPPVDAVTCVRRLTLYTQHTARGSAPRACEKRCAAGELCTAGAAHGAPPGGPTLISC